MAKRDQAVVEIDLYRDVIMGAVNKVFQTFRVGLSGIVSQFDRETTRAGVTFMTRFLGTDRIPRDEPQALNLPVIIPRGGGYGIHFDMRENDPAVVLCMDAGVTGFYENGEPNTPQMPVGHNFGTAICLPGGRVSSSIPGQATSPPNAKGTCWAGAEDGTATVKFLGQGLPSPAEEGKVIIATAGVLASLLLGSDSSNEPVACATPTQQNFTTLNTIIQAIPPDPNPIGNTVLVAIKAAFGSWSAGLKQVGDLKVRVDGPTP